MYRIIALVFALLLSSAASAETPASEDSLRELLKVTEVRQLLDSMFPHLDAMMRESMQQALQGRTLSAEEQRALERMSTKMMAMMRDELSWERLEPMYLSIYRKSFTQEEVDGMLAFYKTPVGVALIRKMPVVMQESMNAMQERMGPMLQKIQDTVQETVAEVMMGK